MRPSSSAVSKTCGSRLCSSMGTRMFFMPRSASAQVESAFRLPSALSSVSRIHSAEKSALIIASCRRAGKSVARSYPRCDAVAGSPALLEPHGDAVRLAPCVDDRDADETGTVRPPGRLPAKARGADRLAIHEPGDGCRAARSLEREHSERSVGVADPDIDARAVEGKRDLQRRLSCR